jgi:mono/diheme cytochrome c family protein
MIHWLVVLALAQDSGWKPGLVAEYSDGSRRVTLVVPTPNLTLDARQSIHPALSPKFKAKWTGLLKVLRAGKYTLKGDAKVSLDGKEIQGKTIEVEPGEHPIEIEFDRPDGDTRLQVQWESDAFKLEPIPSTVLGHRTAVVEDKAERGRDLVDALGCFACHRSAKPRGPDLTAVGSRTDAAWIYTWLENPKHVRSTATMPALLNDEERRDVTAFLAGLKDGKTPKDLPVDEDRIRQGKELFESTGCIACHGDGSLEGLGSKTTAVRLAEYLRDPLAIAPNGRMPNMLLAPEEAELIAAYLVQSKAKLSEAPAGSAERGREIVASKGCLQCHTLTGVANKFKAQDIKGPACTAAHYGLSKDQEECIAAYVKTPDVSEAPVHEFYRTVNALRCNACHEFHGAPQTALPELPPSLSDAGNKLRESWLEAVLNKKRRVRPWMALHMPHFGENTGPLVQGFARACGAPLGDGDMTARPTPELLKEGIKLIGKGENGLSCITCHDFAGAKSLGTRGPDMTQMYERMRPEWFRRWMREPSRIQPGTAMPQFFGSLPDAEVEKKLDLLWTCLSAGKSMPLPAGLDEAVSFKLLVKDEPILLRTFMPNSSPRSIAVGFPNLQSYCFDAGGCRLRYAWFGDFLDVTPVWGGRGGEPAKLLGKKYYVAPKDMPLRLGSPDHEPKTKFRGYELVDKIPVFRFEIDGIPVSEKITPVDQGLGLTLAFEIGPLETDLFFNPNEDDSIKWTSTAGTWEQGRLKIPPGKQVRFSVTFKVEDKK